MKRLAEDSYLARQMVDDMPTNVMSVDVRNDLKVNYINNTSVQTLSKLEQYLPIRADELLGLSIDVFHKNPDHQRRLLADPSNLPHRAAGCCFGKHAGGRQRNVPAALAVSGRGFFDSEDDQADAAQSGANSRVTDLKGNRVRSKNGLILRVYVKFF